MNEMWHLPEEENLASSAEPVRTISKNYRDYGELDPARQDIRLLMLHHSGCHRDSEEIVVSLFSQSLMSGSIQTYEALSYCWGDLDNTKEITLRHLPGLLPADDYQIHGWLRDIKTVPRFRVTANLYRALRDLRHPRVNRCLWVDMLCINQSNNAERSHQVGFMSQIFSKARNVIVWLGDSQSTENANDHSGVLKDMYDLDRLEDSLSNCNEHLKHKPQVKVDTILDWRKFLNDESIDRLPPPYGQYKSNTTSNFHISPNDTFAWQLLDYILEPEPEAAQTKSEIIESTLKKMHSFFKLPWFRRIWVLQEVGSTEMVLLCCGNQKANWNSLLMAHHLLNRMQRTDFLHAGEHLRGSNLPPVWLKVARPEPRMRLPFLELIFRTRTFGATDPRDKLFALLNLAKETTEMDTLPDEIKPDYSKSTSRVFMEYTRWMITQQKSFQVLSAVSRPRGDEQPTHTNQTDYPSWVPNYANGIPAAGTTLGYPTLYQAALGTETHVEDNGLPGSLLLQGFAIETVKKVMPGGFRVAPNYNLSIIRQDLEPATWTGFLEDLQKNPYGGIDEQSKAIFNAFMCCISLEPLKDAERDMESLRVSASKESCWKGFNIQLEHQDELVQEQGPLETKGQPCSKAVNKDACNFGLAAVTSCYGRRFFLTGDNHIGQGPDRVQQGDLVVVLYGGTVPYILREKFREVSDDAPLGNFKAPQYEFIGECYVDGYMNGETLQKQRRHNVPTQLFDLR